MTTSGSLHEITQRILVDRVALRAKASWASDAAKVIDALARGRARAAALKAGPLPDTFAEEMTRAGLSESRQNQLRWALEARSASSDREVRSTSSDLDALLSLSDLYHLGSTTDLPAGWGQAGRLIDGCWCVRVLDRSPIDRFRGYSIGYVAVMVSDLPLRLAELLAELRVPADVIEPMLPFGVQDLLDQAAQFTADDWESLTWSRKLTVTRVEDYLQALVSRQILAPPIR